MKNVPTYNEFVNEEKSLDIKTIANDFMNQSDDFWEDRFGCNKKESTEEGGLCAMVSYDFIDYAIDRGYRGNLEAYTVKLKKDDQSIDDGGNPITHHTAIKDGNTIIDTTLRQFSKYRNVKLPWIGTVKKWESLFK